MMNSFVDRHGLWSDEQQRQARDLVGRIDAGEIETLRFMFPDQHGILRGKTLVAAEARGALWSGVNLTSTLLLKDTSHKTVFPVFNSGGYQLDGLRGGSDFTVVADPATFKVLPWAHKTGWVLCDAYLGDGQPWPFASRHIMQRAIQKLDAHGLDFIAGLEVEFHVFKLDDARMALAQQLLIRALVARFWREPYQAPVTRWGTELHDRWLLPTFVWMDLLDVLAEMKQAGYAFDPAWFADLDLVVALDRSHERILKAWAGDDVDRSKVQLLRSFETPRSDSLDVPDPYYSDHRLFAAVLGMIERADRALLAQLAPALTTEPRVKRARSLHRDDGVS